MTKATMLFTLAGLATTALAQPQGTQVVRGDATITRSGSLTQIRAANNTILNHRSFDIASGDSVQFIQPGANARVLNRITGATPTRIDGSLLANGKVYLVNPAGVFFGQGAVGHQCFAVTDFARHILFSSMPWQATMVPLATAVSLGISIRQRSLACRQRV